MEKVSIAMATYNGGRFLREQLASIAAQTLQPAEMIVCDDRSSDDTVAIVEAFAGTVPFPVKLVINPDRLGPADNFLRAMSLCTAPLVALCDQDDVWLPDKLAISVRRLIADGSLLCMHTATLTDADLKPTGLLRQGIVSNRVVEPLQNLVFNNAGWGMSMTFRRSLAEIDPPAMRPPSPVTGVRMGHDTWMYVLASALGRVSHVDRPLILYRQHGSNAFGVRRVPLAARARGLITVPLVQHRSRARFFASTGDRLRVIASGGGPFAVQATRAIPIFDRLADQAEQRLRLYTAPSIAGRIGGLIACHNGNSASYPSLAKDALLGVCRLGRRVEA